MMKPLTIQTISGINGGMNHENYHKSSEKTNNNHQFAKLGAGILLASALLTGAGCAAEQPPKFSDKTHEYVVPQGGTVWEAAETVEGTSNISDMSLVTDHVESMSENTGEFGALNDGVLKPGEHLVVPDSVEP